MCGIVALLLADRASHVRQEIFDALTILQHRGQDAAGMVTANSMDTATKFNQCKELGMVRDVFKPEDMVNLTGNLGVGHCRYPTAGTSSSAEAQPMYNNYPCGLALSHNGNLTNVKKMQDHVRTLHRHLNSDSDSEVLLNVFAEELRMQLDSHPASREGSKIVPEAIFEAVKHTMQKCSGGYGVVILIHDVGVVAFRDPWGIRPLVYGSRESTTLDQGVDYIFSSETCVVDALGFDVARDVRPGECILALPMDKPSADLGKSAPPPSLLTRQLVGTGERTVPCLFEYVYFARADSWMNGVSVHSARCAMGVKLAERIRKEHPGTKIDVVMPVPDTSRTSALTCADTLQLPYREGLVKNRYIGRTFIMPGQEIRKKSVRMKLTPVPLEFKGKSVLLVDDSIVRGTTSREIISMVKAAGAKHVFFASASPAILHPNVYGIDLPTKSELIATGRNTKEIAELLGCDWVIYQDLADLEQCVRALNPKLEEFENSTFTGKYITGDVNDAYFDELAGIRNDKAKLERERENNQGLSSPRSKKKRKA